MDRSGFWRLIDAAKADSKGDQMRQVELLQSRLSKLPPDEIVAFDTIFDEVLAESYTSELWAAGYIINGGCEDDDFFYFRGWLIAQGEAVFNAALKDPESLAALIEMDEEWSAESEEITEVAWQAYCAVTGADELPARATGDYEFPGIELDEDTIYQRYPKLAEKAEARFALMEDEE